ncbi:MAG TPA: hypothetical protein PLO14_04515 [Accumulibacter sp.]|uniref:hypothetical protein n=1 Tax=Accumulibacter sp. TaxID=2053492 RepID=UPI0025E08C86|nr:hypothetical protein [Accumulibacter sp.]MCM8600231.1 hypothetical protein [Accumulibacter sp.]MCM8664475.1 hypothetical protein [Accumulibacter sp.]HNC51487.1 hypothetical protein [Accumulibacter sp.]
MNILPIAFAGTALVCGTVLAAIDVPPPATTRGELLYSTHCMACHDANVHWRDRKAVTDTRSLRREVRRWQEFAGLGWSSEDIDEVAQYLRMLHYRNLAPD